MAIVLSVLWVHETGRPQTKCLWQTIYVNQRVSVDLLSAKSIVKVRGRFWNYTLGDLTLNLFPQKVIKLSLNNSYECDGCKSFTYRRYISLLKSTMASKTIALFKTYYAEENLHMGENSLGSYTPVSCKELFENCHQFWVFSLPIHNQNCIFIIHNRDRNKIKAFSLNL